MEPEASRVFISYSHDSPIHMDRVLELSNRLRSEGVDCQVDQYEESPAEGWPRWCMNQVKESQFVLVICTEVFERRFDGREGPGAGKGVTFEGFVITQEIYDSQGKNEKFIPIVFDETERQYIPTLLRGATNYDISNLKGYQSLYRRLTRQYLVKKQKLGKLVRMSGPGTASRPGLSRLQRRQDFISPVHDYPPTVSAVSSGHEGKAHRTIGNMSPTAIEPNIRILESDPNKRGDLLGRLMEALVFALGYERARLNIHKSGREIDIEATHRTESRRLVAECKAKEQPIGGDEINKFIGALDAERRKHPELTTEGYFISLSGMTETAVEQETDLGETRFVFLDGARIIEQLILGRILVPRHKAMELAGRCVSAALGELISDESCELVAHEIGWIWVIYFVSNNKRARFALIHADGSFIAATLAHDIVAADRSVGGSLHTLTYLEPPLERASAEDKVAEARTSYLDYLRKECGQIQLDGLPADEELGSRNLRLESMFVPLHLSECSPVTEELPDISPAKNTKQLNESDPHSTHEMSRSSVGTGARSAVGKVLKAYSRIALLGLPGGGKSTLLKRIAIAYAFPDRRGLIDDKLPSRSWLPLFVRCRQLDREVRSPVIDILSSISLRAEMSNDLQGAFKDLVSRSLRDGSVLLLVDGLDEISSERDRVSFVHQLRTFLAIYPNVSVIVTSREAGFRVIGGALSAQCKHFRLCEFDKNDVTKLTLNWAKEVFGNSTKSHADAKALASSICASDRLMKLAANPLLLTTLLLIKRWMGGSPLPTKRAMLYQKAIEVLLMTWNVQGHEPLDLDEALPQLEYLAFSMLKDGEQAISSVTLRDVINRARNDMPELLNWCKISVPDFIARVELRSSLLMQSGHRSQGSSVYPSYEFRHLTFQEYLAARAIESGHYPTRKETDTPTDLIRPFLLKDDWKEVVPLLAVLSGRKAEPLLKELLVQCRTATRGDKFYSAVPRAIKKTSHPTELLAACLLDEVQVSPDLLREIAKCLIHADRIQAQLAGISDGKYGPLLTQVVKDEFLNTKEDIMAVCDNLSSICKSRPDKSLTISRASNKKLLRLLTENNPTEKALACMFAMRVAFEKFVAMYRQNVSSGKQKNSLLTKKERAILESWRKSILEVRRSDLLGLKCVSLWAEVWITRITRTPPIEVGSLFPELVSLWKTSESTDLRYLASWLIATIPLMDRAIVLFQGTNEMVLFAEERLQNPKLRFESAAAFVLEYYLRKPKTDAELMAFADERAKEHGAQGLEEYYETYAAYLRSQGNAARAPGTK
jgi:hypothetical protein